MVSPHPTSPNLRGGGFVGKLQNEGAKLLNMGSLHIILVHYSHSTRVNDFGITGWQPMKVGMRDTLRNYRFNG